MSFIGSDVVITGNMEAGGDIHVDGRIEGDIRCASLIQGGGGRIAGGITADQARIAGLVDGSIATRELILSRTARVTGDIAYESLSIEAGAQVEGNFAHRPGSAGAEGDAAPLKLIAVSPE
jgi:cytoskeletal protein CcmA (bactofilin family)